MKRVLLVAAFLPAVFGQQPKFLPNQAGNDDIELVGKVLVDRAEVQQALGADLGPGYVAVRMKITPKIGRPMRISPDDFTLLSRKDGERSSALAPSQIAGRGALVVRAAARQPGGLGTQTNGPVWGGIGGAQPRRLPGNGGNLGTAGSVESGTAEATVDAEKNAPENPLLAVLAAKGIPDIETKDPVEGLLYFALENRKVKPKDLGMVYRGAGGRLVIDFK
jgi:hypothetical protein